MPTTTIDIYYEKCHKQNEHNCQCFSNVSVSTLLPNVRPSIHLAIHLNVFRSVLNFIWSSLAGSISTGCTRRHRMYFIIFTINTKVLLPQQLFEINKKLLVPRHTSTAPHRLFVRPSVRASIKSDAPAAFIPIVVIILHHECTGRRHYRDR